MESGKSEGIVRMSPSNSRAKRRSKWRAEDATHLAAFSVASWPVEPPWVAGFMIDSLPADAAETIWRSIELLILADMLCDEAARSDGGQPYAGWSQARSTACTARPS